MIVEQNRIDTETFITVFTKKFQNFCTRVPLFVSYDITPGEVTIFQHLGNGEQKEVIMNYKFDFSIDVKENIFQIREYLMNNYYPTMIQKKNILIVHTPEKLNQMISSGKISLDDVNNQGGVYEETIIEWRIEKIIVQKDQVFIRNLTDNEVKRYKLRIPCTHFIQKIINDITDKEERWVLFEDKSKFIGEAYDVDANNNVIERR